MQTCAFCQGILDPTTPRCPHCHQLQPGFPAREVLTVVADAPPAAPTPAASPSQPARAASGPPTGFTEVFISYSRKDKAFVQQLAAALTAAKRNVWVDWDDILPSEDFLQSIYAGIDAANTFLFVLSPDSISSEVCFKEVSHAVQIRSGLFRSSAGR